LVVAQDRYSAEDALSLIEVEYEPLPAVVDPEAALAPGAPLLHEELGSNLAWHRVYRHGDPDQAFAEAPVVIRERFRFPRYSSTPIETYGVAAAYDPITGVLTLWSNFQGLYAMFYVLARSLGLPADKLRLIVPQDVGGSFGIKSGVYPYMTLCGLAAMKTGRSLKWIEDRHEHLISSMCNADRVTEIALAAQRDGTVTAMKLKVLDNVGAYIRSPEPACTLRGYSNLVGAYRIQSLLFDASIAYTNLMPTGSNRGYGCVAHYFALERMMDLLAERLKVDPAAIRLRNFIAPDQFPYTTPTGGIYDSGDYPACLTKALALADYERLRKEQRKARAEDRYVGIGVAVAVDPSASNIGYITLAFDPEQRKKYLPKSGTMETATVGIDGLGKITVRLSTAPHGQGHADRGRRARRVAGSHPGHQRVRHVPEPVELRLGHLLQPLRLRGDERGGGGVRPAQGKAGPHRRAPTGGPPGGPRAQGRQDIGPGRPGPRGPPQARRRLRPLE
ncbi:MAG: carbon-monoxide dehydrogenase large subunit, partial [bacterium]